MHNQELGFPPVRTERNFGEDELAHTFDRLTRQRSKAAATMESFKKSKSTVREFYLAVGATETIAFWMASSKSRADVHCLTKHT